MLAVGQAVALKDLVFRADLRGKCGVLKSFDSSSNRFAVLLWRNGQNSQEKSAGEYLRAWRFRLVLGTVFRGAFLEKVGTLGLHAHSACQIGHLGPPCEQLHVRL